MDLYLESLIGGNLSISGDEGSPSVLLVGPSNTTVPVEEALGNQQFCQECSTFIANSKLRVRVGDATGKLLTAAKMLTLQNGTMFDLDDDGIVDASENLDLVDKTAITDADSPYTVTEDDKLVEGDASGGPIAVTLPAGVDGQVYTFKDGEGSAAANNITITPDGTETIQGAGSYVIDTDWGFVQMYYDAASTDWKILDVSGASAAAVALNTAHRMGDGSDHTDVAANTLRLGVIKAGSFVSSHNMVVMVPGPVLVRQFVAAAPGTIDLIFAQAPLPTIAAPGEDTTIDVMINGISALIAPVIVDSAAGPVPQTAPVNPGANLFVAGDIIEFVFVYTPGGVPTPMADVMASIQCSIN